MLIMLAAFAAMAYVWLNWTAPPGPVHLYILRHGQAAHNVDKANGWKIRDPELTAIGKEQSRSAARSLPGDLALILVSPLRRTLQTAQLAVPGRKMVAVAELQELGTVPCDTGRRVDRLASFKQVDFSRIDPLWHKRKPTAAETLDTLQRLLTPLSGKKVLLITHDKMIQRLTEGKRLENGEVFQLDFML